jgi:glycosyltransferase involved in cell wall biosynthesis
MLAADRIVTLAEVMKHHMAARGVPEEKIVIVPNGVDPESLSPVQRDAELGARLGIEPDETVLGYVSTFHGYEGIQFIIEAVAELRERGRKVRGLLVGDGNERDRLERLRRELDVEAEVIIPGRVPHHEVQSYYSLIDLFIVPRRAEATSELVTPLKPFEAMGMELCVIVSNVQALREIVTDGVTGRTFTPEDARHLADVAEELIDDPEERRRLARAGREWVIAERTWAKNGERYRTLYEDLGVA